ncbi:MAG: DUF58 domain-containing protein [Magnetococcus sp. DMHC-6]
MTQTIHHKKTTRRIRERLRGFLYRHIRTESRQIVLDRRRIFILPDRFGFVFGLVFLSMLVGSLNYNLSLGFVLTFLLGGTFFVSILHTFANLSGLTLRVGMAEPVFMGQSALFPIQLTTPPGRVRPAIYLTSLEPSSTPILDCEVPLLEPESQTWVSLPISTHKRGWHPLGRIQIWTRYPLGLIFAWAPALFEARCLVYPKPESGPLPPLSSHFLTGMGTGEGDGGDDFSGLRDYQMGDSPKKIHWKAAARQDKLLIKQFHAGGVDQVWLDWDFLTGMETEARLARLTRWVIEARSGGWFYGLRLPGITLPPDRGEHHDRQVLKALALFGRE